MAIASALQRWFGSADFTDDAAPEQTRQIAAAVLLVEIAKADFALEGVELEAIKKAMQQQFGVSAAAVEDLLADARSEHDASISLQPYVATLNATATKLEKVQLLESLWRVAYADGVLDRHEEHMMRRIADLLYISHPDFIKTKLRVTGE